MKSLQHILGLFLHSRNFLVVLVFIFIFTAFSGKTNQTDDHKLLINNAKNSREKVLRVLTYAHDMRTEEPQQVIETLLEIQPLLVELNDDYLLIRLHVYKAAVFQELSNFDSSFHYLNKVKETIDNYNNLQLHFLYNNSFGRFYHNRQQFDSAQYHFERCLEIAKIENDTMYLAGAYNNLALAYDSRSEFQQAYEYFLKALTFFEAIDAKKHAAVTMNNLGLIMNNLGEHHKAIDFFQQAVSINLELDNRYNLAMNYGNIGTVYQDMKHFDDALIAYRQSLDIAIQDGFIRDQARAYHNIANIFKERRNYSEAEASFLQSLQICRNHQIYYGVMVNHLALAGTYFKMKKNQIALQHVDSATIIAKGSGDITIQLAAIKLKSEIMRDFGRSDEALELLQHYVSLNDSLTTIINKNHILELQERYETEKKELENQRLRVENQSKSKTIRLQHFLTFSISFVLFLVVLLVFIIFKNNKKVKNHNKTLEKLNDEMHHQNLRLKELNETKDKLFSIVGHDLRSPFNSLLGFLQLLTENFDALEPKEKKEILQKLYDQSNNTYALLENMLQWAMSQRGYITFQPILCNLFEVINAEVVFLKSRADKKKLRIENQADKSVMLMADLTMLQTILRNLINNAIKFTDIGGIIVVSSAKTDEGIEIKIVDNGRGMSQDTILKILNENCYYSTVGTSNEKGTGLGLMIVKDFLKKHNARLTIESEPEKGSVFKVLFPEN